MKDRDKAIDDSIAAERESRDLRKYARAAAELSELREQVRLLRGDLDSAERRLDIALTLDEARGKLKAKTPPAPKVSDDAAAFMLLVSDLHVGERVDSDSVSGRNEYNPEIAKQRMRNLIRGAMWMIKTWRAGWNIGHAVVWIGGDLISNNIHPDLAESNYLSPTEELLLAQGMIVDLLDALAADPKITRIDVPTSFGNHGRTTADRRVSTGWKNSYEWLLYKMLQRHYAGHPKIVVHVSQDEISRLDVLGWKLRFNHGDQLKYQGGVGGLTVPLLKWLSKLDATEPADYTFIGHWHDYLDVGNAVVNNSLIGWSPYAQRVAAYAPPSQVCCLIEKKRGKRMSTEIFVD